jgi:riboflavin synthase
MFSGIVEELGKITGIARRGNVTAIEVAAQQVLEGMRIGDSIAVNGVCLTVVKKGTRGFSCEAMPETMRVTNLGLLHISDKVNLERSLKVGDRISGHFVLGHVDCMGVIRSKRFIQGNLSFEITLPQGSGKFCIPKGSVAVDGISLTIAQTKSETLTVYLIPHTLQHTTLGFKGPSSKVNIEFDILAKSSVHHP